jgi:hypothetical protein
MRVDSSLHIHRDGDVFQGIALGDPFMHVLDVHKRHDRFVLYCLVSVSGTKTTPRMQKQPQAYSMRVVFCAVLSLRSRAQQIPNAALV